MVSLEKEKILKNAVSNYRPKSEFVSIEDVSGHENDTFLVELEDGEEIVCTICISDTPVENCRKEVKVNQQVSKRTDIPTAEILYSSCEISGLPPFYITRKVKGTNGQDLLEKRTADDLNPKERRELTRNIGKLMGELHREFTFPESGEISVEGQKLKVRNGGEFKEYFSGLMRDEIKQLESTKFSDIKDDVKKSVDESLEIIDNPVQNCMIHHDIRPDNMILNRTEIRALLDFEHVTSSHPLIDYAHTEILVTEPHLYFDVDKPNVKIKELRKELKKGYNQKRDLSDNLRKQVETFKFIEHIRNMNTFEEYADSVGMSDGERDRSRKEHKKRFAEMKEKIRRPENLEIILE